jgi:predicted esterase
VEDPEGPEGVEEAEDPPAALGFAHVYLPGPGGRATPTLLLLHGTGGDEHDLVDLGRALGSDQAHLLSPRGKVLEGGAPRFFRRLAPGVFDLEDLALRTEELADFVDAAAAGYGFDPRRVIGVGFSNGANIAASLLLSRPRTLSAALLFHPMLPYVPERRPDLTGTPVLVAAGRADPLVPQEETIRLAELLYTCGAEVTVSWHAGGHQVTSESLRTARTWLRLVGLFARN